MIRFELSCAKDHAFDGWFRSNADFEEQGRKGLLSCPVCGSKSVHKALMTPSLPKKGNQKPVQTPPAHAEPPRVTNTAPAPSQRMFASLPPEAQAKVVEAMRQWRAEVMEKSEDVGQGFAEEARKIHYKEAEERSIYGQAKPKEVFELWDEGIKCAPLPVLPEDYN